MRRYSLRTELLLNISLLVATAITLAVASVVLLYGALDENRAPIYISILVAADVVVLVVFVAFTVERVILRPLRAAMGTAEAIAAGDLQRRLPPGESHEIDSLANAVNRMTDRLLEERAHLVRSEKLASVGRLAAGVAHEVGNPLAAINGYVHVLSRAVPPSDATREAIEGLERESARIDRIVRGLLDYARPGTRATGPVDVNLVARNVIELLALCTLRDVKNQLTPPANSTRTSAAGCDVYIEGVIDPEAEKQRNSKRRDELTKQIAAMKSRLGNESYIAKAPPHLVKQTQDQLTEAEAELAKLG